MPFVARKHRRLLEAARRDRNEQVYWDDLHEAIDSGAYTARDFSLRECFEAFVDDGREILDSWSPRSGGTRSGVSLSEAGVSTGAFANIVGQIAYTTVLEERQNPQLLAPRVTRTVATQFDGEKIPGITPLADDAEAIAPGDPYPMSRVGERWIETPTTQKRGEIVPVLKEDIFFDRTGIMLETARRVVKVMLINKEKRVLDAVTGQTNLYRRNGAAAIATYNDNSGSHDWDNLQASNELVDWTNIENALLLFDGLTDPDNGEPIIVNPTQLIVPTALLFTARRILNATEIRYQLVDNQANASTVRTDTASRNPLSGMALEVLSSAYVKSRTSSTTTWFIGDFQQAFWYMENWGIQSIDAPANSEMEFTHDIAARFKVSERGATACIEPRAVVKCTA